MDEVSGASRRRHPYVDDGLARARARGPRLECRQATLPLTTIVSTIDTSLGVTVLSGASPVGRRMETRPVFNSTLSTRKKSVCAPVLVSTRIA